MASVGLQEIPQKTCIWVNQFVAHSFHPIAMVICELANQCKEQILSPCDCWMCSKLFAWAILGVVSGGATRVICKMCSKPFCLGNPWGCEWRCRESDSDMNASKIIHGRSWCGLLHQHRWNKWKWFLRGSFRRKRSMLQAGYNCLSARWALTAKCNSQVYHHHLLLHFSFTHYCFSTFTAQFIDSFIFFEMKRCKSFPFVPLMSVKWSCSL